MTKSVPFSLSTLRNHSIFSASPDAEDDWELVDRPGEASVTPKKNRMAMREKDLIVAMGKEVRMTCLSGEPWVVEGDRVGSYKVRH
jgi:nucleoporin NUP82